MFELSRERLEQLRDQLRARGQRPSLVMAGPRTSQEIVETAMIAEQWGPFVEAMYLMMAADRRVLEVEREVLRGALSVLSGDSVRTRHMESMLDSAARKLAEAGEDKCLQHVLTALADDPAKAETTVVIAAAIAAADNRFVPEEHALLQKLIKGLGIDAAHGSEIVAELEAALKTPQKA